MVGLLIVSHSHRLAEGVAEVAGQMAGDAVCVVAAGGLLDGDSLVLGTDAVRIAEAIRAHWRDAGMLVLVDMGSAVLSAEQALELLPPELSSRCLISNAPLVEGAIVAALEASLGRTLGEVNAAAEAASTLRKR